MLQSEFYERTKVTLTGDEYADVERMYNSVQMDKDEFCKLWLKSRDSRLVAELMDTVRKLESDCKSLKDAYSGIVGELEKTNAQHADELGKMSDMCKRHMEDFGARLVAAGGYAMPTEIYKEIEQEYGIDFIIKNKWKNRMELQDNEIQYMVDKL